MEQLIPEMNPGPGELLHKFVGDRVKFTLRDAHKRTATDGWRALLRTNLGRAETLRREIIQAHTKGLPLAGASWRDLPMYRTEEGWALEMPLAEVGFFKAKAYLMDPRGWQLWPEGRDVGISVHPDQYRTANTIYCAFARMFGSTRTREDGEDTQLLEAVKPLDQGGYAVIPPSGKLRDLVRCLPHIIDKLGCRILHLLPVHPTPTTYARFGRYGSPYAALDLTAVDPALVEFDRRTTGIDQFRELTYATHLHGGRVFLDIVINHTGWGSVLQENHPEWFARNSDGHFESPGAWGVTWEDLVELKHINVTLWDDLAETLLTWCRRGVDGFRCDAGYKVPVPAWQYIVARVQQEYPNTIFLLEGLGGSWEATEALLTEGGMQWAYSELFQNHSAAQVSGYLDHSFAATPRVGLLVHYSETHDNARLAERGRSWSLLRNRLCALTSVGGGYGFTCGVEWLANAKIKVHGSTGMRWGNADNIVPDLARLNEVLKQHPSFFDNAVVKRLSPNDSPVYALLRSSADSQHVVLVLANADTKRPQSITLTAATCSTWTEPDRWTELLGQPRPAIQAHADKSRTIELHPAATCCLSLSPVLSPKAGDDYRQGRARAAWALTAANEVFPVELLGEVPWQDLATLVSESHAGLLTAFMTISARGSASANGADHRITTMTLRGMVDEVVDGRTYAPVVTWEPLDSKRVTMVPPGHWLLVKDTQPFRAALDVAGTAQIQNRESIQIDGQHIACFPPRSSSAEGNLLLERYGDGPKESRGSVRFLGPEPVSPQIPLQTGLGQLQPDNIVLLTNGRGGMARLCVDLGRVRSKYDCVLGANLHPTLPVDRYVLAKRLRVWVNADGFISPLDFRSLVSLEPGRLTIWNFVASAGDGRSVEIQISAEMPLGQNAVVFHFCRPTAAQASGKQLPAEADVKLTVRLDIEDRGFHGETRRNSGADHHFTTHLHPIESKTKSIVGFSFSPAADRHLRVFVDSGLYYSSPEWSENIPHPVEQSRGQVGSGDAFSPGWFELPLAKGDDVRLTVSAEPNFEEDPAGATGFRVRAQSVSSAPKADTQVFEETLLAAVRSFVVQRDLGKTVIAGYPWFLDWGRDTFICARGLLAAGMLEDVRQLLITFGRFEQHGTLPNTIFGEDASNRDTSDAPLWYCLVAEELAGMGGVRSGSKDLYQLPVNDSRRTLGEVLQSIATHYIQGTPNGIRMDRDSGLIWSPSHFTWMDTNYPAGTPREGYPIEIQALWVRLLRQLSRVGSPGSDWGGLAELASASLEKFFWLEQKGWYADVLRASRDQPAAGAQAEDALRSNCLLHISLGQANPVRARACVQAAARYLLIPGALRTLAPLPVSVPLPVRGNHGGLLNDPHSPYWGRYEGDEDTRRKPAYHNGTAWTWTFPVFCEALAKAWDYHPTALRAARSYLGSMDRLLMEGCIGHIPEILDGDAPHLQRGCDAQAWGATEALRVWKLLGGAANGNSKH